ncbi:hypothetical protein B0H66DRAFT_43128 [Apodospora peruviana]|uniref:Uncharacterized protein n=1 Tax=Apodospora peruviana TaxID=516989 RepID=A0AAE0MEW3_9PEZI|nr:hypothetical protein B0H66DRAFT_43128 [Apodospora peruviana]
MATRITTIPAVAMISLTAIHLVGINAMYGLILRNGYYDALVQVLRHPNPTLPGSTNPILTVYNGIPPLDKLLTLASVMFANVTDGSAPALSVYGVHFAGQFLGVLVVLMIEALRQGNQRTVVSLAWFIPWTCAMQMIGYGFAMPIYGIVHLWTSSSATTATATQVPVDAHVQVLPQTMVLGYIIPSIAWALPLPWNYVHQWLGAVWQGSPVWVFIIYRCKARSAAAKSKQMRADRRSRTTASGLTKAYRFAFATCAVTQLGCFALIAATSLCPSVFPFRLTISDVFLPAKFWTTESVSMVVGIHHFYQYDQYVGSLAAVVWAVALHVNNAKRLPAVMMTMRNWLKILVTFTGVSLFAGPVGAVVWLLWDRDVALLS